MNELSSNINTVANPEQALDQYMGEQFIEWLMDHISREIKAWPISAKIAQVRTNPDKIKKFMLQVFLADEAFLGSREGDPGFLRFAIANLSESDDPVAEAALEILEKRRQEELVGHKFERGILQTVHREHWVKLLRALGLTEEEIDRTEPREATRNYIAELSDVYSNSEWQTAIGAFAAQEQLVVDNYGVLKEFIKNNTSLTDKDLTALEDRSPLLGNHPQNAHHVLDRIVFDQEAKNLVWQGTQQSLDIQKDFLNGLEKYL